MKKTRPKKKSVVKKSAATLPEGKEEMLSCISGIRIVENGKIPAGIPAGEIHDLAYLPAFVLCACYLGYADMKIRQKDKINIPIDAVWDLFNFASPLGPARTIDRHLLIIAKAFELLGFKADVLATAKHDIIINRISELIAGGGGKSELKCIRFNPKGPDPDKFCRLLLQF